MVASVEATWRDWDASADGVLAHADGRQRRYVSQSVRTAAARRLPTGSVSGHPRPHVLHHCTL